MRNIDHRYSIQKLPGTQTLTYLFFSESLDGKEDVLKIIQYAYMQDFSNRPVHNLGFGDFDLNTGEIDDGAMTNNGDAHKIFNTVLSSIPLFFKRYPNDLILVQGSDGRNEYEIDCRSHCVRNCTGSCHNFNRRMRVYCNYVSRKIDIFKSHYQFLGGSKNEQNWFDFEEFVPGKLYGAIMVFQKNS